MNKQSIGLIVLMLVIATLGLPTQAHRMLRTDFADGSGTADVEWWPMFHHDVQLSGYTPSDSPDTYNKLWDSAIDRDIWFSSPAVVDDKLAIGTGHRYDMKARGPSDALEFIENEFFMKDKTFSTVTQHLGEPGRAEIGKMYCLNAKSGEILWEVEANGSVFSSPAIENGRVYFVSADFDNLTGELYCLNIETGSKLWSLPMMTGFATPTLSNGRIYLLTIDPLTYKGKLLCLDAEDGSEIWNHTGGYIDFSLYTAPALAAGKVFYTSIDATSTCKINCLNQSNGQLVWTTKLSQMNFGYALSSPVINAQKAYVISAQTQGSDKFWGLLTCVDTTNGSKLWNYSMQENTKDEMSFTCPAVAYGRVYFTSVEANYAYGKLYCLNGENGTVQWVHKSHELYTGSSPIVSSGKVFVGGLNFSVFEGKLYCYDAYTGDLKYSVFIDNFLIDSSPAIADDTLYIGASTGKICALKDPFKVGKIKGGFLRVNLDITNNGDNDVENIVYTMSITGGIFHMINKQINGTIPVLEAQTTDTITIFPIIGFGKIQVNASIKMEGLNPVIRQAEGFLFGIFVIVK